MTSRNHLFSLKGFFCSFKKPKIEPRISCSLSYRGMRKRNTCFSDPQGNCGSRALGLPSPRPSSLLPLRTVNIAATVWIVQMHGSISGRILLITMGLHLKEMGIPDHLTCLLRNLHAGQEATVEQDMEQRNGRLVQNWERNTSRLDIVTLLI